MVMIDATKKQSQRAAYVAYVELYWRWARLAADDPAHAALAEATRRAEARWRALMFPASDTVLDTAGGAAASPIATPVAVAPVYATARAAV